MATSLPVYVFEVDVLPCDTGNQVIQGIKEGITQAGKREGTNVIWLFKVMGENQVVSVVEGNPEAVIEILNDTVGCHVKVTCIPCRPYESFARSVNNLEEELCTPNPGKLTRGEGHLYYVKAEIHFKGLQIEDLKKCWLNEARHVLGLRKKGLVEIELWKWVGTKTILVFIRGDADGIDDLTFTLPIATEMGDNVEFPMKEIRYFD